MAIRLPLRTILSVDDGLTATGPASTAGGVANRFQIPQDTDNVVVKYSVSIMGGGASATLQTSDDGGTTWYDVARTSIVSNATSVVTAQWISAPVVNMGMATGVNQLSSLLTVGIGAAGASTLGGQQVSGLPILGVENRIFRRYGAAVTSILSESIRVMVNNQSATA